MNRITKRAVFGGGAVLASIGAVLTGATVTSAAIDTADEVPADAVIEVEQVAQDADGGWYSCKVTLDEANIAPVPVGEAAPEAAIAGGGIIVGAGDVTVDGAAGSDGMVSFELSTGDLDAIFAGTVPEGAAGMAPTEGALITGSVAAGAAEAGAIAVEMAGEAMDFPTPDEIRAGTQEECDALLGG